MPEMMKAALLTKLNAPLELTEVPVPAIANDEVLVKVESPWSRLY